jgi:hypothetical protein
MYPAVYPLAIDIAENLPNFEHLLPLRIMVERGTPSGGTKDGVNALELFVQDLEPEQQAIFLVETVRYTKTAYRAVSNSAQNRRIADAANSFVLASMSLQFTSVHC